MPNPREALTKEEPVKKNAPLESYPAERTLCPESQPLRNPTCLPSGEGAGQRVKPSCKAPV